MFENCYIGNEEYIIRFRNGTHEVLDENGKVVFTGWYEKCKAFLNDLWVAYLESRF